MIKAGDVATAPSWSGPARWPVKVLERPKATRHSGGETLVLVRWLGGPLKGRDARLRAATVRTGDIFQ